MYEVPTPPIHQLSVAKAFRSLSPREKLYAHFLAQAAWHGTRIVLRQVSPEAIGIFDFIIELFHTCSGDWDQLVSEGSIKQGECYAFLEYAATFLSNVGNYYGHGDQKFIPSVPLGVLQKLSEKTPRLGELFDGISNPMTTVPPYSLGPPGDRAQSAYYPGPSIPTQEEISIIKRTLEELRVYPENTRLRKCKTAGKPVYEVLQASVQHQDEPMELETASLSATLRILKGDHSEELKKICSYMAEARKHAANENQRLLLSQYIMSFQSGELEIYRESQRTWIKDRRPRVENIFGFVEPYRDPYGTRAEFQGLVGINDVEETIALNRLVEQSSTFIRRLPWAGNGTMASNNGKGPFEKTLFDPPDISSLHTLAYCSSIIFPGINLPNYNDIRDQCGFKNVIIANRMSAEGNKGQAWPFIDAFEVQRFQNHKYPAYYLWVVLHELLGHGTGRMLVEESSGTFNFDPTDPPLNPLTGSPITSWYKPGQTWTGQFGDLATTVDECRAELVGAYLMDDEELLSLFGFNSDSTITADDLTYNTYQQLGVDGLRGLANFNVENGVSDINQEIRFSEKAQLTLELKKWGQAHSRAHFAILKCLLVDGGGCVNVEHNEADQRLIVRVDRSKIRTHGKPALGRMLLRLHMYRCTADVASCREYYEGLSEVTGDYLKWRVVVLANRQPRWVFSQANTFLQGDEVILKEYEPTARGVIESWAERKV